MASWYHDVIADIREEYGLDYGEALDFYRTMRDDEGFGRAEWEAFLEEPEPEPVDFESFYEAMDVDYEYDIEDLDDFWLDDGEEIELTVDYEATD